MYIQLPLKEFYKLEYTIRKIDPTISSEDQAEGPVLVSGQKCEELYDKYKDLQFRIHNTIMRIKPRGYLYPSFEGQSDCQIGIQGIPDELNEYRLGAIFLRNFYVGLDF
jgi:hypothetical protein